LDKQQAQDIVRNTFESPFDKGRFVIFVKDLLNHIDESKSFSKPLTQLPQFKNQKVCKSTS